MKLHTPDGFTLDADFHHNPNTKTGVIFAHGMTVARDEETIFVRSKKRLQQLAVTSPPLTALRA